MKNKDKYASKEKEKAKFKKYIYAWLQVCFLGDVGVRIKRYKTIFIGYSKKKKKKIILLG